MSSRSGFSSIDEVQSILSETGYVCGRALATVVFLAGRIGRPLFLEGEAGVGRPRSVTPSPKAAAFSSSAPSVRPPARSPKQQRNPRSTT